MRHLLLLLVSLLSLAACDSGQPTSPLGCADFVERADTLFIALGERETLDLDALFAGVSESPLTYDIISSPNNSAVALEGSRVAIEAEERAEAVLVLGARASCGLAARARVVVDVIDSPTCSLTYDPTDADFFPLYRGARWRFAYGSQNQSVLEWEVTDEGACANGRRTYSIRETASQNRSGWSFSIVAGDSLLSLTVPGAIQRRYPGSQTNDVTFQVGSFCCTVWRGVLRRDVGPIRLERIVRQSGHTSSTTVFTLIEGP